MNQPDLSPQVNPDLAPATSWCGSLNLVFAHDQGTTQLVHNQVQAPLKVQRPFYPEGREICHGVVLHTAGGVVGGDRLSLNLHLKSNAQALVTTAAAGKIYRSQRDEAKQTIKIQIDEGACLEWLPQETIVFNRAIYRQDLRVELAANSTWLGWEITRFGRSARGERFLEGNWRSHTEVWRQGQPLWIDPQWLQGGAAMLDSPHGLAGYPVVGSFAWMGQAASTELVDKARNLWTASAAKGASGETGVTRLIEGLLCRYRGTSTVEARRWFVAVWQLIRSAYLGRSLCIPRVWQI